MAIEWTQDLSTNIDEIDAQHRELFRRVNDLLDACGEGKGRDEVERVIGFFQDYVITHFDSEEAAMRESNYPDYESHKAEHVDFMSRIGELKQKRMTEGSGLHLVLLTIRTSVDWLTTHIRKTDRKFADYVNSGKVARPSLMAGRVGTI